MRPDEVLTGKAFVRVIDNCDGYLESIEEIPEPHVFTAHLNIGGESCAVDFVEHEHGHETTHRDNNMRAADGNARFSAYAPRRADLGHRGFRLTLASNLSRRISGDGEAVRRFLRARAKAAL